MRKTIFYALSIVWGLPMILVGACAALVLTIFGHHPKRYGLCWHFKVGEAWGGISLGLVIITDNSPSISTCNHEHGHALQNCLWGPLFLFVIALPSVVRYWVREFQLSRGKALKPYDSIWFEGQASRWGSMFIYSLQNNDNCK